MISSLSTALDPMFDGVVEGKLKQECINIMSAEVNGTREVMRGPSAGHHKQTVIMAPVVIVGSERDCPPKKNDTISCFSKCPKAANMFPFKSQGL